MLNPAEREQIVLQAVSTLSQVPQAPQQEPSAVGSVSSSTSAELRNHDTCRSSCSAQAFGVGTGGVTLEGAQAENAMLSTSPIMEWADECHITVPPQAPLEWDDLQMRRLTTEEELNQAKLAQLEHAPTERASTLSNKRKRALSGPESTVALDAAASTAGFDVEIHCLKQLLCMCTDAVAVMDPDICANQSYDCAKQSAVLWSTPSFHALTTMCGQGDSGVGLQVLVTSLLSKVPRALSRTQRILPCSGSNGCPVICTSMTVSTAMGVDRLLVSIQLVKSPEQTSLDQMDVINRLQPTNTKPATPQMDLINRLQTTQQNIKPATQQSKPAEVVSDGELNKSGKLSHVPREGWERKMISLENRVRPIACWVHSDGRMTKHRSTVSHYLVDELKFGLVQPAQQKKDSQYDLSNSQTEASDPSSSRSQSQVASGPAGSAKVRIRVNGRTQMLWRKYGSKSIVSTGTREGCVRCYYKCFNKQCNARLVEDTQINGARTVELVGTHSHDIEFPPEQRVTPDCNNPITDVTSHVLTFRGRSSCP